MSALPSRSLAARYGGIRAKDTFNLFIVNEKKVSSFILMPEAAGNRAVAGLQLRTMV